ncbi:MAG: S8 family serine peptidase [Candidatus Eisenbacteria bacterium]
MLRHLRHLDVAAVSRVAILAVALGSAAGSMARGDERILTPDAALSSTNRPDEESPTTANIDNSMAPLRDQELTSQEQIDPGTLSEAALGDSKSPQELTFVGGTLIPEPGIGASLRQREAAALQGGTADEETYCFVMFDGRTTPGRLSTLTAVVSEVLGYHHYHSYKVRLRFSDVERVAQLPFVYWVGYVQPEQKIHPDLVELRRHDPSDRGLVVINLFDSDVTGASLFAEREEGGKRAQVVVDTRHPHQEILRSLGAEIVRYDEVLRAYVASVRLDALSAIAGLDFVLHVEPLLEDESHHDQSTATVYTDYLRDASGPGYDGTGVSIGIMDSGYEVDHVDLPTPGFHVSYCTGPWDEDGLGHGSHVAGTVLGRGIGDGRYTGNAPGIAGSDLQIVRLFDNSGNACGGGALDAMDYFALSPRPRIVHGSLGAGSGGNGTDARSRKADQYIKDYGQIYVFSAGNGGSGSSTVGAPGDAKNVITVGNTLDFTGTDGDADDIWTSSSRGPTGDGRYKPDVCAPGRWIWSVNAATTNGYKQSSGTSMAAPHVSGIVAGYLEHYPSRAAYPALVKAALGSASLAHGGSIGRDNSYGMGRIDAMMLHYSADNADGWNTLLVNNTSGLGATGNWGYSDFTLPSGVDRLVITLNWIENAASSGDSYAVINDLDLYLDLGNNQSGGNTGDYSSITSHDNVEYIVVSNPPAGTHRVKVYAYDINDGPQPFSFVVNYYRGDPTPTSDVSQQIDDVMVQPFEEFHCTASVTPRELIAKGFWTELDVPGAVQVLAMERTLEDGEVVVYDSGDSDPSRYGINLGDVQYDVSRTVTWTMRGSSEGVHRVGIDYDSDNSGTATTAVNVTVDGTVPNSTITSCPPPYSTNNDPTLCWTGTDNYTPVAELVYSYRLNGGSWSAWTRKHLRRLLESARRNSSLRGEGSRPRRKRRVELRLVSVRDRYDPTEPSQRASEQLPFRGWLFERCDDRRSVERGHRCGLRSRRIFLSLVQRQRHHTRRHRRHRRPRHLQLRPARRGLVVPCQDRGQRRIRKLDGALGTVPYRPDGADQPQHHVHQSCHRRLFQ